jgi:hypothetical protein
MNEYLITGKTYLIPILCKLFNNILNTRHFPELWVQSIIIPVFKKGNINEPKTYRGISLVDYVRKLYSRHCLIGGYYKYNGMNNIVSSQTHNFVSVQALVQQMPSFTYNRYIS